MHTDTVALRAGAKIYEGEMVYEYAAEDPPGRHLLIAGDFGYEWTDRQLLEGIRDGSLKVEDVPGYEETPEQATGAVGGKLGLFRFECPLDRRSFQSSARGLESASVVLVGCGALGAKIGTSLARSGVGCIDAIDDELAHGRNPVWGDVGRDGKTTHRAHWLCYRLYKVDPGVHPLDRHTNRSTEVVTDLDLLMQSVHNCDVIIDATASGDTSEKIAGWAEQFSKPLVWANVLADGLGGVIGRWRPGIGLSARQMRHRLNQWCSETHAPVFRPRDLVGEDRNFYPPPFTDENAVTLLAAHTAEIGADVLSRNAAPNYEDGVYLVGLRKGWIFEAPFTNRVLDMEGWRDVPNGPQTFGA